MANIKQIQIEDTAYNIAIDQAVSGQGYGACTTAAATAAKTAAISNYELNTGGIVIIKFTYAVPANATLNINSKGAKNIFYKGSRIIAGIINAGETAVFIYDGTQYHLIGLDRDRIQTTLIPFGTQITASSSSTVTLNSTTYLKVGNYFCSANAQAEFITDLPKAKTAFMMQVYSPLSTTIDNEGGTWVYRIRKLLFYTGEEYVQYCYSNGTAGNWTYGPWWRAATAGSNTSAASGNTANSSAFNTGTPSTANTANSSAFNTGTPSTANTGGSGTLSTGTPSAFTNINFISGSFTNGVLTLSSSTTSVATSTHTHSISSHSHTLNSHTHSVGAHSHGLNSHTHSVGAHSHGLNSHTHTQN